MLISDLLPRVTSINRSGIALQHRDELVTYGELHRNASCLARAFQDGGIAPGDRVGLLGHPCVDLVTAEHAAVAVGAIPVGIFPSLAPIEIQSVVDDAAPAAIVFDPAHAGIAAQLRHARTPLEISCDRLHGNDVSVAALIRRNAPLEHWHQPAPDAVAVIIYTGGTTGRPKGVMHTHKSLSSWFRFTPPSLGYAPTGKSILFNLAHASGQSTLWMVLAAGGRLVLLDRYPAQADEVVDLIEQERITTLGTVSATLRDILNLPDIERRDLRSLRSILVGGAFISRKTLQRASDVFPSALILDMYSLTESGHTISVLPVNLAVRTDRPGRLTSVGQPAATRLFGQTPFSVRIVDAAGHQVPMGDTGEIVVRGDQMMTGYWKNPESTQLAIRDGWLYTGDIGRLDEEGYLYLVDRKRDMIIANNGVCVYSSEVEHVVERHPAVAEVAVIGVRLEDEAEHVTAVAALHEGATVTLPELQQFCGDQIASFKIPTNLIIMPSLPRTNVGKIHKARLREMWAGAKAG